MRNVFLYWVGTEYKLIKICRDLLYLHSNDQRSYIVNIINDKNILLYIPNLPNDFFKLSPTQQAAYARVRILCDYGGIWIDADTIVMDDLNRLFEIVEQKDGFFIRENNESLYSGVVGSRANTRLLHEWLTTVHSLFYRNATIDWSEAGTATLERIQNESPEYFAYYNIFNGLDTMYPVPRRQCSEEYLEKPYTNYKKYIRKFQPLLILASSVRRDLESQSEVEILYGKRPLNYFLNRSMGITEGFRSAPFSTNNLSLFLYSLFLVALVCTAFSYVYRKKIVLPTITLSLPLSKLAT